MTTLPKIPLESSADLAYLRSQIQSALQSRLQTHLPNALPEDQFRLSIEKHISSFLSSTMQEVSGNILINGLEPRPSDIAKGVQVSGESYEPHDTALHANVLKRHAELEDTITRVTTLRREVPERLKSAYTPPEIPDTQIEEAEEVSIAEPFDVARIEEVITTYEKSLSTLEATKGTVSDVASKLDRAKEVFSYIQAQQQS